MNLLWEGTNKGAVDFCEAMKGKKTPLFYCTLGRFITPCFNNRKEKERQKRTRFCLQTPAEQ